MAQTTKLKSIKTGNYSLNTYPINEVVDSEDNSLSLYSTNPIGTSSSSARRYTWTASSGTFQLTISELNVNVGGSSSTLATQFDTGKYVLVVTEYV